MTNPYHNRHRHSHAESFLKRKGYAAGGSVGPGPKPGLADISIDPPEVQEPPDPTPKLSDFERLRGRIAAARAGRKPHLESEEESDHEDE